MPQKESRQQQQQQKQKNTEKPSSAPEAKRGPAAGLPSKVKGSEKDSSMHGDFIALEENGNPVFVQQQKQVCKGTHAP